MYRKSILSVVLFLALAGSVSAESYNWINLAPDTNSWEEPNNWRVAGSGYPGTGGVPGVDHYVLIRPKYNESQPYQVGPDIDVYVDVWEMEGPGGGQPMSIGAGGNFNIGFFWNWDDVGEFGEGDPTTVNITGNGVLRVGSGGWDIAERTGSRWELNVSGNPEITVAGNMRSTYDGDHDRRITRFYLNMGGGTLDVNGRLSWGAIEGEGGPWGGGGGELNVSGGATIDCNTLAYEGGGERDWTLNLDGGTITVIGEFSAPRRDPNLAPGDANAFMNLDSGTLECGSFNHGGYPYAMDINEGVFIIDGNEVAAMNADVNAGYITAFNGTVGVRVTYDEILDKTIVKADIVQVKAWGETPENYALNVCPDANNLSWQAGAYCVDDHNVYFGTSMSDVNESASPFLERHDTNSFTPSLELGKTYYWRVDEVNDGEVNSPWVGDIWEFTTNDGSVYDPYPRDLAIKVDPNNVELEWTSGCTAQSHDVYLGTDFGEVDDANSTSHPNVDYDNVTDANYSPGNLDFSTYYFWRIDEVDDGNTYKGRVWQFKTKAFIPDPNMVVWYKFDETSGNYVKDSSGHEIRGDIHDYRGDTWDPCDGRFPGCIHFHEDERVDLMDEVFDYIGQSISISVWWKDAFREDEDNNRFCGFGDDDLELLVRADSEREDDHGVRWQAGNDTNDRLEWTTDGLTWKDDWHHLVFTKNGPEGTMKIYFDTVLVASTTEASGVTLGQAAANAEEGFNIGTDRDGDSDFAGKADDFRVYRCEISQSKINGLFRGGNVGVAWRPSPYDGQVDVPYDVNLAWLPGDYVNDVNGHDVYFGTDFDDVNDANSTSHPNVEYGNVTDTNYAPVGLLELGQIYYWRVDEVNDSCSPYLWKGEVWRFTVAEYITIDDMEDYGPGYPITSAIAEEYGWDSGLSGYGTGSIIDLVTPTEYTWVLAHGGDQAMYYTYDSSGVPYYSEIVNSPHFELDPNDWTIKGVKMLTLWFYGDFDWGFPATAVERMYVGLEDTSNTYAEVAYGDGEGEDADDIAIAEWQEWNIALNQFTSVTLGNVDKLYIGFGDRDDPVEGGVGNVVFDSIRLYPPTCVPSKRPSEFAELDMDNDCAIGWGDVEIMGEEWLKSDVNLGQVSEPCDANLVGWWKFDEGSGNIAGDSSGKNHHGTLEINDVNVFWVAGHPNDVNYALDFDGGRVRVPDHQDLRPMHQVSVCAWIKYSDGQKDARVVVKGAGDKETYRLEVDGDDDLSFQIRDGNDYDPCEDEYEDYDADSDDDALERHEWIHVAGTFDGNTVKCYINGELAGESNDPNTRAIPFLAPDLDYTPHPSDLSIGKRPDNDDEDEFEGIIDDVRVYDYGLSAEEIGYLASDGTGLVVLQSIADVYAEPPGQGAINFKDLAKLGAAWFDEELWPE
jgi:hypothetical protein